MSPDECYRIDNISREYPPSIRKMLLTIGRWDRRHWRNRNRCRREGRDEDSLDKYNARMVWDGEGMLRRSRLFAAGEGGGFDS
jgi:hypothetical protein